MGLLLLAAAAVWLDHRRNDTTLTFVVRDAVSQSWVYDAKITVGDRVLRSFFQADNAPVERTLTGLRPGKIVLAARAPGYRAVELPLTLTRGTNRVAEPIDLVGLEIPDLTEILVVIRQAGDALVAEIRPVDSNGSAVLNHPVLDLWIAAMVSVQMDGSEPAGAATDSGGSRGEVVYAAEVPWQWDSRPETLFRYTAHIPGPRVVGGARVFVVDLIILVPQPAPAGAEEIGDAIARLWQSSTPDRFIAALQRDERFRVFLNTVWNVKFG